MGFSNDFKRYSERVDNWLRENVTVIDSLEKTIYESMNYSLMAGGKRLRPVLSLAVCDMLGGNEEAVLPFACAIELIHTYSLIHDDLPCMDNDDFRRGKPTNHRVFGEALAVLSGDALLNLAFETMLKETIKDKENCFLRAKAAFLIAKAAGTSGMIGGQVIDIESQGHEISYDHLCTMHQKKTGALIKASVLLPAELFDAPKAIKDSLEYYAEKIGLAFQIKDDILDFEGDSEIVGKPTGSDEKNSKCTFVTLMGLKEAKELLNISIQQAVDALKSLSNADFLVETAFWIAEREK